jgi:hypothetical protein
VVFNDAVAALLGIIRENIKEEYDRWRLAKLFRDIAFSFLEPRDLLWQ